MTPVASPSRWPSSQAKLGLFPAAGNTACGVLQYHLIPGLPSNPILHQMPLLLPPHRTSSTMPLCSSHIVPLLNHLFLPESQETCLPDASFPLSGASFSQSYPRWDPKPSYREELLPIFLLRCGGHFLQICRTGSPLATKSQRMEGGGGRIPLPAARTQLLREREERQDLCAFVRGALSDQNTSRYLPSIPAKFCWFPGYTSPMFKMSLFQTSLVVQWLRIHLPMQGRDTGLIPCLGRFHMPWGS